jgi:hypothetical protein
LISIAGKRLIDQWYKTMRTLYTRAKGKKQGRGKGKSGCRACDLTEREEWILRKLQSKSKS